MTEDNRIDLNKESMTITKKTVSEEDIEASKDFKGKFTSTGPIPNSIFLCIPNTGWLHTVLSMQMVYWAQEFSVRYYCPAGLRPLAYARNMCAKAFMKTTCEYLWFVDADTLPILGAPKLLMDAKKSIITGVVPTMKLDAKEGVVVPAPMTFKLQEDGSIAPEFGSGIEQIEACGMACCMMTREVLNKIEFPWFEERPWGEIRAEDMIFCAKLKDAGIPLYAHYDVVCEHYKEVTL